MFFRIALVLQKVHPLQYPLGDGADVQLLLEVLGDDGARETERLLSVDWGVTQDDGGGWGWVPSVIHTHLHHL